MTAGLASAWDPNGNGADIPSSEQKVLVEQYRVSEDGAQLILDYTVSDPAYLDEPYSDRIVWRRMPADSPIHAFECDADIAPVVNDCQVNFGDLFTLYARKPKVNRHARKSKV